MVLTELERHDGLSILATNRPYERTTDINKKKKTGAAAED